MSTSCAAKNSSFVAKMCNSVVADRRKNDKPLAFVEMCTSSICGTDVRTVRGDKSATPAGITLGHEAGGVVAHSASGLFSPGDTVVVMPHLPCGQCRECEQGYTNLCRDLKHLGIHQDGCLATHGWFPEQCLRLVSSDFPVDLLPLVEPLACVDRGIRLVVSHFPSIHKRNIAVIGGGPIGALHATALRNRLGDQPKIAVIDPHPLRRESIEALGVVDETAEAVNQIAGEFDVAILCTSSAAATRDAIECIRPGGKLLLFSGYNERDLQSGAFPEADWWEAIHRGERIGRHADRIRGDFELIGSSGYQARDVDRSLHMLTHRARSFEAIQNVVVDGLDSRTATFHGPGGASRKTFDRPAVEVFLAAQGIDDPQFGDDIARALKVLFRVSR